MIKGKVLHGTNNKVLAILIKIFCFIWIFSVLAFAVSFLLGTDFLKSEVTKTVFGNTKIFSVSFAGSLIIGTISFFLMVLFIIIKILTKNGFLKYGNSLWQKIFFIPKLIFILLILPLFLIFKIIISESLNIFKKILFVLLTTITVLPVWVGGYYISGLLIRNYLGYAPEIENIAGTGSMYPTWPKGEKGKTPDELAKEVVSKAGFLRYPNGIEIAGKRYLNHTIERGDIVTAKNDAILKTTSEIYSTPSGVLKRVVALGGDTIELKDGIFYLNGQPQKEQYIATARSTYGEDFLKECQKYTVPSDSVFLMGDNRKGSGDSREFGPVKYSEIMSVLPIKKQIGSLDKNWHNADNDLLDITKPTIDRDEFVKLLNEKRAENGVSPVKYEPKLEDSAEIRGKTLIRNDKIFEQANYNTIVGAMSKAGYWNSYVWEWSIEGYYSADELIEDYIERDSTDAKDVWFDKKFDDIGIAEVQGEINGCPTQIIVIHAAGYVPPNYKQSDIDSWKKVLDNLESIKPGWEDLKNYTYYYERYKSDVDKINEIISVRISRISSIYSTMSSNKWLSADQEQWMKDDDSLYKQQEDLAIKLNSSN